MQFLTFTTLAFKICCVAFFSSTLLPRSILNQTGLGSAFYFVESVRTSQHRQLFINTYTPSSSPSRFDSRVYAVPKKKPSRRRTRIRKTAWMKRFPKNYKKPMMLDMFDIVRYTDGTFTKSRTVHENWLNLPATTLDGNHVFNKEVRPSW